MTVVKHDKPATLMFVDGRPVAIGTDAEKVGDLSWAVSVVLEDEPLLVEEGREEDLFDAVEYMLRWRP